MLTLIVFGAGLVFSVAVALLVGKLIRHGTADDKTLRRMRRAGY